MSTGHPLEALFNQARKAHAAKARGDQTELDAIRAWANRQANLCVVKGELYRELQELIKLTKGEDK